jgi:hypothetical protein
MLVELPVAGAVMVMAGGAVSSVNVDSGVTPVFPSSFDCSARTV